MAVPEWKIEQELELIKHSNLSQQDAYILGSMKHKSLQDLKKNIEAFNNLKNITMKFSIPPQPKLALFQALVDEDIHTLLNILSKYTTNTSPPESLLLNFNPSIQPSSTINPNPSPSIYPPMNQSYPTPNRSPPPSLPQIPKPTTQPNPTPAPTKELFSPPTLSSTLAPTPYISGPSNPLRPQPAINPAPQPLFRAATSIDIGVLKCAYCGEPNPIGDGLIRCKCGYKYCYRCLQEDTICECDSALNRRIQPKCN